MNAELLADKLELAEMGARYCDACDRKDWDAALALFAKDAHLDATTRESFFRMFHLVTDLEWNASLDGLQCKLVTPFVNG